MISSARIRAFILIAILLFAASYRLAVLNSPFARNTEGCAAFFEQLARDYFRYDFSQTHGIPVMSMGKGAPIVYYANHPPTTAMLIALVHAIGGYRGSFEQIPPDWQVRLPTAIFTLACVVVIYVLLNNRGRGRAGLIAAMLFASIPMTLTYGGFPDVINPQLLFFAILSVAAYEHFHDAPSLKRFGWLAAAFAGAAIMDWPAFHLVPVLGLHFIITKKPKQWLWIIGFGIFAVILFIALYAYLTIAQADWGWMKTQFSRRGLSSAGDASGKFDWKAWFKQAIWAYAIGRHTLFVTILAVIWLVQSAIQFFNRKSKIENQKSESHSPQPSPRVQGEGAALSANRLAGLLLAWAALHVLLGRQGVFQHEWWWWPLTPGLVMAAGLALDSILSWAERSSLRFSPWQSGITVSIVLILFAASKVPPAWREQTRVPLPAHVNYRLDELGAFIRQQVPPDACGLIAESDESLPFWDYADRGVRRSVWSLEEFNKRSSENFVDLPFLLTQPCNGPFVTMIAPRSYLNGMIGRDFVQYLDQHFKRHENDKFVAWDLRTAMAMR